MKIEDIVEYLLGKNVDFCDVRLERRYGCGIGVVNGELRYINIDKAEGVSIRVMINGVWGYASTTELTWDSLKSAAERAYKNAEKLSAYGKGKLELDATTRSMKMKAPIRINPMDVDLEDKIDAVICLLYTSPSPRDRG